VPTEHEKIMVLRGAEAQAAVLNGAIKELERSAEFQDGAAVRAWLKKIVPEYEPFENSPDTRPC